ncbi:hypothetical protein HY230_10140 [Candidatus Acetothermia bacterium]|nr:hypothetical protein [Candidatus Acetothermia bacterium]
MVLRKRIEKLQMTLWVRARQLSVQINESVIFPEDTTEYSRIKSLEKQLDTVRRRLDKVEYIAQSRLDRKDALKSRPMIDHVASSLSPPTVPDNVAVTAP